MVAVLQQTAAGSRIGEVITTQGADTSCQVASAATTSNTQRPIEGPVLVTISIVVLQQTMARELARSEQPKALIHLARLHMGVDDKK